VERRFEKEGNRMKKLPGKGMMCQAKVATEEVMTSPYAYSENNRKSGGKEVRKIKKKESVRGHQQLRPYRRPTRL